jgi:hypothetical protein
MRSVLRKHGGLTLVPLLAPDLARGRVVGSKLDRWWRLELAEGRSVEQTIALLEAHPDVEVAEPNFLLRKSTLPDDPLFPDQWGLDNIGQSGGVSDVDIDWPEARSLFESQVPTFEPVVVGVLDTGFKYDHEDLIGSIWINPMGGPDISGYDYKNKDADPADDDGHGTHVSGTIAQATDNHTGLAGVAPPARIMGLKFLGAPDGTGSVEDAIVAITYAEANGARLINASWGSYYYSQAMHDAIEASPLLFFCAAGNDALETDQTPHYPSSYPLPNVIGVAAHDRFDNLWPGSNFGASSVDLAAPGDEILGTVPIELPAYTDHYAFMDDTSIAAPHVTGAAALLMAARPDLGPREVKQALLETAVVTPALAGATLSGGRLNLEAALQRVLDPEPIVPPPLYTVEPAPFDWTELNGDPSADVLALGDEETHVGIPIGFTFPYYGDAFTAVNVSSNGYLYFGDNLPNIDDRVNTPLTQANMIAPWWDDFDPSTSGLVYTKLVAPGVFVVEFDEFAHAELPGGVVSFQVVLYEAGEIVLQYNDTEFGSDDPHNGGGHATVGVAGTSSETLWSFDEQSLADGLALRFLDAPPPAGEPPDVSIGGPPNGAVVEAGVPVPFDGTAIDDLDGDLTPGLLWSSHIDGPIGTGGSFLAPLSPGVHTVLATVTDSSGISGSASTTVLSSSFPASSAGRVEDLLLGREPNGDLTLAWGPSCAPDATDYAIYTGSIDDPTTYGPLFCSTQGSFTQTLPAAGPDDSFFLIVPRTPTHEGSYGLGTGGLERPPGTPACGEPTASTCPETPSSPKLEMTVVTATDAWQTVSLPHTYSEMVVVCTPNYDETVIPVVTRVQDVTATGFDLRVQSTDGSPVPVGVPVHCLTAEEGVYTVQEHGVRMEVARFVSTVTDRADSWVAEQRAFHNQYQDPVIVGQVMTSNADWSTFWCKGSSQGGSPNGTLKIGKQVAEDPAPHRVDEEVGWIVIEAGSGVVDGRYYAAALGGDFVRGIDDAPPYSYPVNGLPSGPAFGAVVSQFGMDGGEGSWAVLYGGGPVSSTGLDLAVDEDQARDSERSHTSEQVGYIVFED